MEKEDVNCWHIWSVYVRTFLKNMTGAGKLLFGANPEMQDVNSICSELEITGTTDAFHDRLFTIGEVVDRSTHENSASETWPKFSELCSGKLRGLMTDELDELLKKKISRPLQMFFRSWAVSSWTQMPQWIP